MRVWRQWREFLARRALRAWVLILVLLISGSVPALGQAQVGPVPVARLPRSSSGQFIIQNVPHPGQVRSRYASSFETNRSYITLDATVLPVSCERIKQALWRQLGLRGQWSGRVFLGLYTAGSGDDPVTLTSAQFRDGWQYRLELPDLIDRVSYVRSIVDVLLLEVANRTARERSAEIPTWLSEGLSQELLFSSEMEILLPPPRPGAGGLMMTSTLVNARKENPLTEAHNILLAAPPISFQQLSWPGPEQLEGDAGRVYRSSAQLFVNRLLRLPDGQAALASMLAELPRHYNWQFAFLQAFRAQFQRPLDVEKWWALQVENFTGRDLAQAWPPEESWSKLDALIRSGIQVYAATNDLPLRGEVKLQAIIKEWDRARQLEALQTKVRQLEQLRLRLAAPLAPLADQYHRVLVDYLENRDQAHLPFRKKAAQRHAAQTAIKELDQLDRQLATLRPPTQSLSLKGR